MDLDLDSNVPLTLDGCIEILQKTILHPGYVWSLPALALTYGKKHDFSPLVQGLIVFAILCDIIHGLAYLNKRYISPYRPLDPLLDTIVVTGGSSGLGLALCAIFGSKGYAVFNLDVSPPEISLPRVEHIKCDVSKLEDVELAKSKIESQQGKVPTVLVNNAATVTDRSILDLSEKDIRKVIDINLLSHFWTTKTFLPGMISNKRGYIITVSSVLGYIGPARLSTYSASKAGLNVFHDCLSHENDSNLKTLLVTIGQMDTPMFKNVTTPSPFLAPVLTRLEASEAISKAIEEGLCGELSLPTYAKLIHLTKILPASITEIVRRVFKMDQSIREKVS